MLRRTPGYAAPGQPSLLSPDQIDQVVACATTGGFRTMREAMRWVEREFAG